MRPESFELPPGGVATELENLQIGVSTGYDKLVALQSMLEEVQACSSCSSLDHKVAISRRGVMTIEHEGHEPTSPFDVVYLRAFSPRRATQKLFAFSDLFWDRIIPWLFDMRAVLAYSRSILSQRFPLI